MEAQLSRTELELLALREGFWHLSEFTAYALRLSAQVSRPLRALLKAAHKAHPALHA